MMKEIPVDNYEKIFQIFAPYAHHEMQDVLAKRLIHYTSAEAALSIIRKKEIWLRNVLYMNDSEEVLHGLKYSIEGMGTEAGKNLMKELGSLFPPPSSSKGTLHNVLLNDIKYQLENPILQKCYVFSMGIVDPTLNEYNHGKLSMWRGYGGANGVALVLNPKCVNSFEGPAWVTNYPVKYTRIGDDVNFFESEFKEILKSIRESKVFIQNQCETVIKNTILNWLYFQSISVKHIGFEEECECRLIYSDSHAKENNKQLPDSIESIRGNAEKIFKLNFGNLGAKLNNLIDRIIIGPGPKQASLYEAFIHLLEDEGVSQADKRVVCSDTPYRG